MYKLVTFVLSTESDVEQELQGKHVAHVLFSKVKCARATKRYACVCVMYLCKFSMLNTQRALQGTCVCNLRSFILQSLMLQASIYVHVAPVLNVYVQYTESPTEHVCAI